MNYSSFIKLFLCSLLFSFVLIWSCKKNDNNSTPKLSPAVNYVSANLKGRVVDANHKPISNVNINTAFASTTTDINGFFSIANTQLDKNAGYVTAQKAGYYNGSRTFLLNAGSTNFVEIELINQNQASQFNAITGGIVSIGNYGSISFPANAISDSSTGTAYSGIVNVSASYLDPTANNFGSTMPGALLGIGNDSSIKVLNSFSMMVAVLTGSNGQKLKITNGKTASISITVPSPLLATAPQSITLWYFDEIKGLWRQQGNASLQGNNYIGSVAHFSYWSANDFSSSLSFQALIKNPSNTPLSGASVNIRDASNPTTIYGYGNSDVTGAILGFVPANKQLLLTVYDNCGDSVFAMNFTTQNSAVNLGTLNVIYSPISVSFSGTVNDCDGNGIANGILNVYLDGVYTSASITNGVFTVTINRCYSAPAQAQLTAINLFNNLQDTITVNNVTNQNIDSIKFVTCNLPDQYIYYTVNSQYDTLSLANVAFNVGHTSLPSIGGPYFEEFVYVADQTHSFYIGFSDTTAINIAQTHVTLTALGYDSATNILDTLTLTQFGAVGTGYIAGSFSGQVTGYVNSNPVLYPIRGRLRVKRTN